MKLKFIATLCIQFRSLSGSFFVCDADDDGIAERRRTGDCSCTYNQRSISASNKVENNLCVTFH